MTINDINTKTHEGRLLMAALATITTEGQSDKTPDEALERLVWMAGEMYPTPSPQIKKWMDKWI